MNRTRPLLVSLAVALATVAGVLALGRTLGLGQQAHASRDPQIARRTAQLDRYQASLQKALDRRPPALPPLPATTSTQTEAPVHVVYHRPPPIVVTTPRHGGDDVERERGETHE